METKPVRFAPRAADSAEVQARLAEQDETVARNMERIRAREKPDHWQRLNKRGNAILQAARNVDWKIQAAFELADEGLALANGIAACKRGCSHCCHIAVGVLSPEAAYIGKRIGRKPANVPGRTDFEGFDWGYHNPCTFLRDGECSIYEHRPMACRAAFNMDSDALMCELTPPESKRVPWLDPLNWNMLLIQAMMSATNSEPKLGDIREFFPKVTK